MTKAAAIIENLAFEGGGTKGSAYAGSMQIIEELNLFHGVKRIAGTSAGSITAVILATGGGSAGLTESIEHTNFSRFLQDPWGLVGDIKRVTLDYGLHSGDEFVVILKQFIGKFSGNPELTFHQLEVLVKKDPKKFKHLSIIASNLTTQQAQVFNVDNHPNLPIWLAVRASMSIPLLFEPVKINSQYHVDGGLAWNFPIDLYDTTSVNETNGDSTRDYNAATLGFFLEPAALVDTGKAFKTNHYPIDSLKSYASALGSYFYETANSKHMHPEDRKRTVFIDDLGIDGKNFNISKKNVEALIASGRKATREYFSTQNEPSAIVTEDAVA